LKTGKNPLSVGSACLAYVHVIDEFRIEWKRERQDGDGVKRAH
jgi:hypothetical protein